MIQAIACRKQERAVEPETPTSDDPIANLAMPRARPIDVFFSPQAVAVIGATETPGSVGRNVIWNLVSSPFGGMVFPVNAKRPSVLGIKAYPNLASVPAQVDLAIVITPAPTVPDVIAECAA